MLLYRSPIYAFNCTSLKLNIKGETLNNIEEEISRYIKMGELYEVNSYT